MGQKLGDRDKLLIHTNNHGNPIPIAWRYLFPWQILPDPGPEQILQLSAEVEARVRSGALPESLSAVFEHVQARIDEAVRRALSD